ncbi:MAG TPA: hypothetical protein VGI43_19695 [Mucilaginibacter sp.]|jgi:hypothetical protein
MVFKRLYKFLFVDDLLAASANSAMVKPEPLKKKLLKDLASLTLFSYILFVFNPVMPVIADKMAHSLWLEYHMVTVHHVYGSKHILHELSDNAKQSDNNKSSGSVKTNADDYVHVIPQVTFDFLSANFTIKSYPHYHMNSPIAYSNIHYQPPKV